MKQMTPEQRAHAIARITAAVEAKMAEEAAAAEEIAKAARVKAEKRRAACNQYNREYEDRCKAAREADPALRQAYLEKKRIRDRANYHRKKANQ